jgi:diacylglycerol kinase (ATP)
MIAREWRRLKNRLVWSLAGLRATWIGEPSFKFWTTLNVLSATLAFSLPLSLTERGLILALGLLVLAMELANTGIEHAIDYISQDEDPRAKAAKDAGSAAVFMVGMAGLVVWITVLIRVWS